jgi:hypothetical protein
VLTGDAFGGASSAGPTAMNTTPEARKARSQPSGHVVPLEDLVQHDAVDEPAEPGNYAADVRGDPDGAAPRPEYCRDHDEGDSDEQQGRRANG